MQAVSIDVDDHDTLTVVLRGELDFTQASQVVAVVREAIEKHRPRAICVDLAEVSFLDSSGIGVLVQAMKAADQLHARFAVQHATEQVYDQLSLAGLVELFGMTQP
jgi:anti-sigma B factor antagonist